MRQPSCVLSPPLRPALPGVCAAIATFVRRALAGPALAYAFIAEPVESEVDAARIRGRRLFGRFSPAACGRCGGWGVPAAVAGCRRGLHRRRVYRSLGRADRPQPWRSAAGRAAGRSDLRLLPARGGRNATDQLTMHCLRAVLCHSAASELGARRPAAESGHSRAIFPSMAHPEGINVVLFLDMLHVRARAAGARRWPSSRDGRSWGDPPTVV